MEAIEAITDPSWTDEDKTQAIVAYRYLASIGKGENALELANVLEENLKLPHIAPAEDPTTSIRTSFVVPQYIFDSITWVCQ
tara:strand:- start:321 stop:566 length:246 start_codon:yes stop_codon:yes gene_type:complete